jgi:hypothetical protein
MQMMQIMQNFQVSFRPAIFSVVFYFVCYYTPNIYILFLKRNFDTSDEPITGFHKLNAILFLFVLLCILSILILLYIFYLFRNIAIRDGSFNEKVAMATSKYIASLWDDGKMMPLWIALFMSLVIGYLVLTFYYMASKKDFKMNYLFSIKENEDEDQETNDDGDDDVWKSGKIFYRMMLSMVMSVFLFGLILSSVYYDTKFQYAQSALYLCAIVALFCSLEWKFTFPMLIVLLIAASLTS